MRRALLLLALTAAATAPVVELEWPQGGQPRTKATIKAATVTARVGLGFDSALLLNLAPAQAARLKAFPIIGKQTIKNAFIPGGSAVARGNVYKVALGTAPAKNVPTVWIDKPIAADADAIVSALSFDADRVVLTRPGGVRPGRVYTLVRKGKGEAASEAVIAGTEISVTLDVVSPETIVSAAAAAALIRDGRVKRAGAVGLWMPFPNVRLPFERLTPAAGATVLGLPLTRPAARITEARMKELDAQAARGTSTAEDDADAITVTATRQRREGRAWVLIGRDVLDRCSRIDLDRPGKRWLLTCDFA